MEDCEICGDAVLRIVREQLRKGDDTEIVSHLLKPPATDRYIRYDGFHGSRSDAHPELSLMFFGLETNDPGGNRLNVRGAEIPLLAQRQGGVARSDGVVFLRFLDWKTTPAASLWWLRDIYE